MIPMKATSLLKEKLPTPPPPHTIMSLALATQCCLFWCFFQPWLMLPLLVQRMVACRKTLTAAGKSREDDEMQIVWAKAGRGIWSLGHVFEGNVYFTKHIVEDNDLTRLCLLSPFPRHPPSSG